jgi:sarcosine oxidase subunit alpha
MQYVPELGGNVPLRDEAMRTSRPDIFIAGDVAGVEEASAAMVAGKIAGLAAARDLGISSETLEAELAEAKEQLAALRSGPVSAKIRSGLAKAALREVG